MGGKRRGTALTERGRTAAPNSACQVADYGGGAVKWHRGVTEATAGWFVSERVARAGERVKKGVRR
jgi:hypothetical protein